MSTFCIYSSKLTVRENFDCGSRIGSVVTLGSAKPPAVDPTDKKCRLWNNDFDTMFLCFSLIGEICLGCLYFFVRAYLYPLSFAFAHEETFPSHDVACFEFLNVFVNRRLKCEPERFV